MSNLGIGLFESKVQVNINMNFSQYSSLKVLVKIIINELNMMSSMVFRKPICNSVRNTVTMI